MRSGVRCMLACVGSIVHERIHKNHRHEQLLKGFVVPSVMKDQKPLWAKDMPKDTVEDLNIPSQGEGIYRSTCHAYTAWTVKEHEACG